MEAVAQVGLPQTPAWSRKTDSARPDALQQSLVRMGIVGRRMPDMVEARSRRTTIQNQDLVHDSHMAEKEYCEPHSRVVVVESLLGLASDTNLGILETSLNYYETWVVPPPLRDLVGVEDDMVLANQTVSIWHGMERETVVEKIRILFVPQIWRVHRQAHLGSY
jgi:hypothetical protein